MLVDLADEGAVDPPVASAAGVFEVIDAASVNREADVEVLVVLIDAAAAASAIELLGN